MDEKRADAAHGWERGPQAVSHVQALCRPRSVFGGGLGGGISPGSPGGGGGGEEKC